MKTNLVLSSVLIGLPASCLMMLPVLASPHGLTLPFALLWAVIFLLFSAMFYYTFKAYDTDKETRDGKVTLKRQVLYFVYYAVFFLPASYLPSAVPAKYIYLSVYALLVALCFVVEARRLYRCRRFGALKALPIYGVCYVLMVLYLLYFDRILEYIY